MIPFQSNAEDRIGAIRFQGNVVTQEETMLLEMDVHEGDVIDLQKIEQSVQQIMDLGIFVRVTYYLEKKDAGEDTDLVIVIVEPYYWYVLPTFKFNDNSELELGLRLRWNNLFGYNHRLVVTATDKGSAGGVNEYSSDIEYTFPRFLLSRFSLSLKAGRDQRLDNDNVLGDQREIRSTYAVGVRRWLNAKGISSGPYVGFGIGFQRQSNTSIDPLGESDGDFESIMYSISLGRDRRHKYEFQRGGDLLEYDLGLLTGVSQHTLTFRDYIILSENNVSNLNYLVSAGYANDDVLGNAAFSLGGNSTLRGYRKDAFHGNIMVRTSIEYLSKFNKSPLVRKVAFIDAGDVQDEIGGFRLSSLKVGAGAGIRWKARYFVNLDIRLDIAYGFDTDELRVVIGSRNTF